MPYTREPNYFIEIVKRKWKGRVPATRSIVSHKVRILGFPVHTNYNACSTVVGDDLNPEEYYEFIGAISNFNPSFSRPADPVRGIGTGDVILELIPGFTDVINISVSTILFYLANFLSLFGIKSGIWGRVRSLAYHQFPFDVKEEIVMRHASNNWYVIQPFKDAAGGVKCGENPTWVSGDSGMSVCGEAGYSEGVSAPLNDLNFRLPYDENTYNDVKISQALITAFETVWITEYSYSVASDTAQITSDGSLVALDATDGAPEPFDANSCETVVYGLKHLRMFGAAPGSQ